MTSDSLRMQHWNTPKVRRTIKGGSYLYIHAHTLLQKDRNRDKEGKKLTDLERAEGENRNVEKLI